LSKNPDLVKAYVRDITSGMKKRCQSVRNAEVVSEQ